MAMWLSCCLSISSDKGHGLSHLARWCFLAWFTQIFCPIIVIRSFRTIELNVRDRNTNEINRCYKLKVRRVLWKRSGWRFLHGWYSLVAKQEMQRMWRTTLHVSFRGKTIAIRYESLRIQSQIWHIASQVHLRIEALMLRVWGWGVIQHTDTDLT